MKMLDCFEGGEFYNHLILSGTKIGIFDENNNESFTIT